MKGIQLSIVAPNLSSLLYVKENHEIYLSTHHISVNSHHIFTLNIQKVCLTSYLYNLTLKKMPKNCVNIATVRARPTTMFMPVLHG